jgi:YVTN family beta-propeller protein
VHSVLALILTAFQMIPSLTTTSYVISLVTGTAVTSAMIYLPPAPDHVFILLGPVLGGWIAGLIFGSVNRGGRRAQSRRDIAAASNTRRSIALLMSLIALGSVRPLPSEAAESVPAPSAPAGTRLFASIWGANYICVADTLTMREIKKIPADNDGPATSYLTNDGRRLYLENGGYRGRTVSIIDPRRMTIDHQIPISGANGDRATRIEADGRYYYVSTIPQRDITQIDTQTERVSRVFKGLGNDFTVSRDGKTLFVLQSVGNEPTLTSFEVATGRRMGSVSWPQTQDGFLMRGFAYTLMSEDGNYVYSSSNPVRVIDVRNPRSPQLVASIPVGRAPLLPALSPDGGELWVPNAGDGTISVIDTRQLKVVHTIATGRYMAHVAFEPDGSRVYVSQARADGPKPEPNLLLWLYLVKMGLGGLFGDEHGIYHVRPLLDTPGEIVAYDARTYQLLPLPAVQTVTVAAWLTVAPLG